MADMGNDHDLVRRLRDDPGDQTAQRELYERYRSRLVGYCRTRLTDPDEAEDCAQDVFQDVFTDIAELRDARAFESWMFTIAARKISRYNSKPPPAVLSDGGDEEILDLPDPVTDVEHNVRMRELLDTVADAIDSLQPPLDAVIKEVIGRGGLRGSELAPRFGWDTRKADHELNRARRGLVEALETLVVVRTGRDTCDRLNDLCTRQRIRPGRAARLSQDQRRRVHRHITQCRICGPQARVARDRGQWALGPGLVPLADHLRQHRPEVFAPKNSAAARRAAAALTVALAMVTLPAASTWLPPAEPNNPTTAAFPSPSPPPATTPPPGPAPAGPAPPSPAPAPPESAEPAPPTQPPATSAPQPDPPAGPPPGGGGGGTGGGGGDDEDGGGGGGGDPSPPSTPPPTVDPPPAADASRCIPLPITECPLTVEVDTPLVRIRVSLPVGD
jgi:RNA polymerase sigma factor (sigma-70 family)